MASITKIAETDISNYFDSLGDRDYFIRMYSLFNKEQRYLNKKLGIHKVNKQNNRQNLIKNEKKTNI